MKSTFNRTMIYVVWDDVTGHQTLRLNFWKEYNGGKEWSQIKLSLGPKSQIISHSTITMYSCETSHLILQCLVIDTICHFYFYVLLNLFYFQDKFHILRRLTCKNLLRQFDSTKAYLHWRLQFYFKDERKKT